MSEYYVYVYLDKSKPGDFAYGGELRFPFLPRYIGKGKGRRAELIDAHNRHNIGLSVMNSDDIEIVMLDEGLSDEKSKVLEIEYIGLIGRLEFNTGPLFNKTAGGEGNTGLIHSEETKRKMSEANMGEKNHFYGKHHSEETLIKLSEALKGRSVWNKGVPITDEHREKLSEAKKGKYIGKDNHFYGKKHTPDTRKKMRENHWDNSGENHPNFGKHHSEETRRRISDANKCRVYQNPTGENNPISKEYIILPPDGKFISIKGLNAYCRENNLLTGGMGFVLKGTTTNHKGYRAFHIPCILLNETGEISNA